MCEEKSEAAQYHDFMLYCKIYHMMQCFLFFPNRLKMWWLLVTVCFIHMSGNAFCFLGKIAKNPEASMNVVSYSYH